MRPSLASFWLLVGLSQSIDNINIDINISEDEVERVTTKRNTTSTIFKADDDNFVNLIKSDAENKCGDEIVTVGEELKFGDKNNNVIGLTVCVIMTFKRFKLITLFYISFYFFSIYPYFKEPKTNII